MSKYKKDTVNNGVLFVFLQQLYINSNASKCLDNTRDWLDI